MILRNGVLHNVISSGEPVEATALASRPGSQLLSCVSLMVINNLSIIVTCNLIK